MHTACFQFRLVTLGGVVAHHAMIICIYILRRRRRRCRCWWFGSAGVVAVAVERNSESLSLIIKCTRLVSVLRARDAGANVFLITKTERNEREYAREAERAGATR